MQNASTVALADARLFQQGRLRMGWCRARLGRTLLAPELAIAQWERGEAAIPAAVLAWVGMYAGQGAAEQALPCACCGAVAALVADAPRRVLRAVQGGRGVPLPLPVSPKAPPSAKRRTNPRRVRRHFADVRQGACVCALPRRSPPLRRPARR